MEGKKGLPHLFNNGKPSEMDAKSFYNFLNWLDKNDGIINNKNSKINEKLDGSSQFFGSDDNGFFWEKFGSDKKFRSAEEIPEYWAGYRELFKDMEETLEWYFEQDLATEEFGLGSGYEIKVQVEVINSAGSHSDSNYEINLVPYKKDSFKSKGCLSFIQLLINGENFDNREDEECYLHDIAKLFNDTEYTAIVGYSIDDYEIDLSAPAMKVLEWLDQYPFEQESEKFGITLNEIEDILDLPTRKFNQSTLKGLFEEAKKTFNDEILSQMKGKTGALSENGMFEGLAIVLDNGFAFKVNSPEFKEAFLKHHQDAVAKKMNKVQESTSDTKKGSKLEDIFSDKKEFPPAHKLKKEDLTEQFLDDLKYQLAEELSKSLENVDFSWKQNTVINVCDKLTGRELVISEVVVDEPKIGEFFIFVPNLSDKDRTYASIYFFKDKKNTFASVKDAINFPKDHEYYLITFRKHNNQNMTGDTAIQECMQGIACDLSKYYSDFESLKKAIEEKIKKNGFDSIPLSGGKLKIKDFNEEKLHNYLDPAVRTGLAFIEEFSEYVGPNTKTYHPDMNGPLKTILDIGKPLLNGLKKDCWNPTDILITDYTSEEIKKLLSPAKSLSDLNSIMKELIVNSNTGKCFIPLSLKLNTSEDRSSVVEKINLEDGEKDYHVSSHYVNTTGVGNEIDVFAHINGKAYKFYFRCNGGTAPIIEGQHLDNDKYFKNSKFVNDETENRDIISRDDIDIESYRVNEKDNTSSFLGKAKSIIFSAIDEKTFKSEKEKVNFNMDIRHNFHEGSLPWRLIEMADKIEALPEGYGARGKGEGHSTKKASLVAELARDYAKFIVMMKWSTEEAIIYLLTCSMKENWGAYNTFAPLYKIS